MTDKKKREKRAAQHSRHRLSDGRRQAGKTLQPDNHSGSSFHSLRIFYQNHPTKNISSKEKENKRRLIRKRFTPFLDSDGTGRCWMLQM
jgi:hypothetical protein